METDPLDIHHVVIKSEYEDDSECVEVEPVIIKSEVFEDGDSIEVEPTRIVNRNEPSESNSDDVEVKPTPHTDNPNVPRKDNDISCSSSTSSLASGMHLVSNMDWDLNQCCRICAQKSSDLVSVFSEEGLFRQLTLKMRHCLQIIVQENDDLPTAVCWKCVSKLEVCFELMQEHIRGQNVFQRQKFSRQVPLNWKQAEARMEFSDPGQLTAAEQGEHVYDTHEGPTSSLPLPVLEFGKNRDVCDASCSGPSHVISDKDKNSSLERNAESENKAKKRKTQTQTRIRKLKVSCEFCGKVFNHTGDLNKHRRKHTGEHPYPCPQCHKRFSHASNLIRHQKIHSGETLHKCATCSRTFSRKDNIVKHIENSRCKPSPLAYLLA